MSDEDAKKMHSQELREHELSETELRYRMLFEQSPDGVLIIDTEGNVVEFNEAAHRQLGYTREEFATLNIHDLEAYETSQQIQESIRGILDREEKTELEVHHRTKSGEIRNVLVITQAMVLRGRSMLHAIWRDITEQKRAEEQLRKSEEKYRDLFENAIDPIFIIDANQKYVDVNKRAIELFGFSKEEFLSMSIFDVIPPEQVPRSRAEFDKLHQRGAYEKFVGKMCKKDGTYIDIEVSSSAIYENGRVVGSRDIVRDITDRRQAEQALCRAYEELEARVQERTRQLAKRNEELRLEIEERTKAEAQLKESKALSDALNAIDTVVHSTLDFDAIMQRIVIEAAKTIGVDASSIGLFQDGSFVIRYVYNLPQALVGHYVAPTDMKGIQYAAMAKDVVAFNDAYNDERLNLELVRRYGIRSMLIAPLTIKGNVLGAMNFYYLSTPTSFTDNYIDFIRKLSASLSLALENARLYEERRQIEETMRHMAHHDVLTGLANKRLFMDIASVELAQAHRNRTRVGILFLDLDRFKEVNDTLGHEAGDELLKEVAERLASTIRESDTIARIGGDEFNIILPNIMQADDISFIARKVMDSFREPYIIAETMLPVTTSIGISIYPDDGEDMDTLLKYADIAMYHAKELGKNNYQFYNPTINILSLERIRLESSLRQALERGGLMVYYQPQVDIATRKVVCAEALVRWQHPERGLLGPQQFIPMAEETGLITAVDEWVLRTSCRQFRVWQDAGLSPLCVTVNLSAREFQDAGLVAMISRILEETGLPPECLDIEITESVAMSNIERTSARLDELKNKGVRISIDDFGTGYSSLNYLKRLPIQRLKIDQSFISDIARDPDDRAIISAVAAMAHSMRLTVVAEGVETEDQLAFLEEVGCEEMQGYLFSRPLPSDEFSKLLAAGK